MFEVASSAEGLHAAAEPVATKPAARQRTLAQKIACTGVGLHSGAKVEMTLHPAPAGTGIVFRRTDLGGALIPATWDMVRDTRLNTCIANAEGAAVRTIEHLMSAFVGAAVDNAVVELDGPEVPVMDGSAAPFLFLIECAGTVAQDAPRRAVKVLKRITVADGDRSASLAPAPAFSLRFEIDFDHPAIRRQEGSFILAEQAFKADIARARTFGFEHEVAQLQAAGLARGGSLDNAVVIGGEGVLNAEGLRYEDEFVRHKILDAIGDLALAGGPILGHFHGVRSGHALNNQLLRALFADRSAWCWTNPAPRAAVYDRIAAVA